MRPQHSAANAVVRWGREGQTCLLVCTNCSEWMAINYISLRNGLFFAKTKITYYYNLIICLI